MKYRDPIIRAPLGEYDRIRIRDLRLTCIVGINEDERTVPQEILVNITIFADLSTPCSSDRIGDTIDYKAVKNEVIRMVEASSYFLIEKLAEEIARICLSEEAAKRVVVSIDKPHALSRAKSVSVEIARERTTE